MSSENPGLGRILYLQRQEVLTSQAGQVQSTLTREFPDVIVDFAGGPLEVPPQSTYDAIIAPTVPWLPDVLARVENKPWIHFQSAGVERIWTMDFNKSDYLMSKSSGIHAVPMSEFVIGAMLHFAKRFDLYVEQSRNRMWDRVWLDELAGRKLVILGLGNVGQAVAAKAQAFGMAVSGVRNSPGAIAGVSDVRALPDARQLLCDADYVVVTLPLTDETRNVVDADLIRACKPGAVLVDVSRGGVVDGAAVSDGITDGILRGAALDVFSDEPLPATSELWGRREILITPHVSGTTPEYLSRVLESFIRNARTYIEADSLTTAVDVVRGY